MGIFSRFENKVEDTVEGAANSLSNAPISPVQISRRCERQMIRNKMLGTGKQYAPTLYTVLVNPDDDSKLCTFYPTLAGEIETYLRAKAGSAGLYMDGSPLVRFIVDDKLKHGKFDVIAEVVASSIIYQLRDEEMKHYGLVQAELAQIQEQAEAQAAQAQAQAVALAQAGARAGAGTQGVAGTEYDEYGAPYAQGVEYGEYGVDASYAQGAGAPYGEQTFCKYGEAGADIAGAGFAGAPYAQGSNVAGASYDGVGDMQFSADDPYAPHIDSEDPYAPSTPAPAGYGSAGVDTGASVASAGAGAGFAGASAGFAGAPNVATANTPNNANVAGAGNGSPTPAGTQSANASATNASAHLISSDGTQRIELHSNKMIAGRASNNDIVIPDINASRKHAEFSRDIAGRWVIRDLGSKNGTLVNGEFIQQPTVLYESDTVTLGLTNYRYTQR